MVLKIMKLQFFDYLPNQSLCTTQNNNEIYMTFNFK